MIAHWHHNRLAYAAIEPSTVDKINNVMNDTSWLANDSEKLREENIMQQQEQQEPAMKLCDVTEHADGSSAEWRQLIWADGKSMEAHFYMCFLKTTLMIDVSLRARWERERERWGLIKGLVHL